MRIEHITMYYLRMPLVAPFETSFGRETERDTIILAVSSEGITGWAEAPTLKAPFYNEETTETAWHILRDFLIPSVLGRDFSHPSEIPAFFSKVRGNNIAKSGLEGAVWDLYAKSLDLPLWRVLGGKKNKVPVGVSLGIQESVSDLIDNIEKFLAQGYRKIKVKIKPGKDVSVVREIRRTLGDIPLMVDANSAYSLSDLPVFKEMDELGLIMIEQPLGHDDIFEHSLLQKQIQTPICLDESILHRKDAKAALELGSAKIINIKISRVGGLTEAKAIHDLCLERNVPVWCGGMLETGIGRAHNIAIATLEGFTIPGDTSASSKYWEEDIIDPEVVVEDGYIDLDNEIGTSPGIGYKVVPERLRKWIVRQEEYSENR